MSTGCSIWLPGHVPRRHWGWGRGGGEHVTGETYSITANSRIAGIWSRVNVYVCVFRVQLPSRRFAPLGVVAKLPGLPRFGVADHLGNSSNKLQFLSCVRYIFMRTCRLVSSRLFAETAAKCPQLCNDKLRDECPNYYVFS